MLFKDMTRQEFRLEPDLARVFKIALIHAKQNRREWGREKVLELCKEYAPDDLEKISVDKPLK